MNKFIRICIILILAAGVGVKTVSNLYSAPAADAGKSSVKTPVKNTAKTPAKTAGKTQEVVSEKPVETKQTSGYQTNIGNLVTTGGGYYMPLGEMGTYLNPTWSVKVTYQDNQRNGSPIGLGADLIYSYPPDKEVNGGMMIITAAPHVSLTIPFFSIFDLQFKAGPGLTVMTSILDSGKKASGDMTLHSGVNISRVFYDNYYVGLGSDFYYIFERKNLRTLNSWFSIGYRW